MENNLFISDLDKFLSELSENNTNVKYVDPYNPYTDISPLDTNTIILPNLESMPLSELYNIDDNIYSESLDRLLFNFNFFQNDYLCHLYFDKIEEYFLNVDLTKFEITMSVNSILQIQECINNGKRLVILPIRLDFLNIQNEYTPFLENDVETYAAHANLVIIDTKWQVIEFFEPHGIKLEHAYSNYIQLPKLVEKFVKNTFNLQHYNFVNIANLCPIGVQQKQSIVNPISGHCAVWTLYFIMLRLLNIHFIPKQGLTISETINQIVLKNDPYILDTTIRQFLTYIESLGIIPVRFLKTNNNYNMIDYLDANEIILLENRLRYLIRFYFFNAVFYKRYFKKIFEEIISYKNLPNFDNIFIEEIANNNNLLKN